MKIIKGIVSEPQKVVIYGPQGIGKSSLAALFPSPLFLDTEKGSRRLAVEAKPEAKPEDVPEANYGPEGEVGKGAAKHRTTRPLIFAHEGKEWTYHKPGDPMPCDGEQKVYVLFEDFEIRGSSDPKKLGWGSDAHWKIIGWRYADTTKQVELGPEDVPPGSVLKANSWAPHEWRSVGHVYADGVLLSNCPTTAQWSHLMLEYQINRSIPLTGKWDANAWEPCHKTLANG